MSTPRAELTIVEERRRLMGTFVSVHVAVPPVQATVARAAITASLEWLVTVEACLTRFVPTSELSQLNATAGTWHDATPLLFAVTQVAVRAAATSDGLFDPTLLPLLASLGYDRDIDAIAQRELGPAAPLPAGASGVGQWRAIELDEQRQRIRLPVGAQLDVGGIAKGWAADVALEQWFADFPHVLINVGGDMRLRGGPLPGDKWAVGVADPRAPAPALGSTETERHIVVLALGAGGLATSGASERWWYRAGERHHHILDPRTQRPAHVWVDAHDDVDGVPLIATATALAPTAAQAEVAAKVALLRGLPTALTLVDEGWHPTGASPAGTVRDPIALILALGTGTVMLSAQLHTYLEQYAEGGEIWLLN